ncbi:hypothetical protein FQA39_LY03076 [Lamprigera yunnana]|nr:hypothetical protein FQA39_LY03076 [Lamprigera yunnana]
MQCNKKIFFFKVPLYGARHTQALLLFVLMAISLAMRMSFSVTIVAMTSDTSGNPDVPIYSWTDKSILLSSYSWGNVFSPIVVGQLAEKYGAKWFVTTSFTIASIFSILIPFLAPYGSWTVMLCRVIQGFANGFFFPCCHNLLSKWSPLQEKTTLSTFVYAAGPLGMAISMICSGFISATWVGWPYVFYGHGAIGLVWMVVWSILGKNSPSEHKKIDPREKDFIVNSIGNALNVVPVKTPWMKIATSLPFWAILISSWGEMWGLSTLSTHVPRYFSKVLDFNITDNGILSAGPHLLYWVSSFVFSFATDYIITHKIVSTTIARKIANSIGVYLPGIALLILALISDLENIREATLAMFYIAQGFSAAFLCGFSVNIIDLAPNHAGTLMGISNTVGNVCSIIAPLIVQFIVVNEEDAMQWAIVFYISAGMCLASNTFYLYFASVGLRSAVERLDEELSALEFDANHEAVYGLEKYYTVREREQLQDKYEKGRKICLAKGIFFPSCHNLLAKWSYLQEKSRLNTFVYAAGSLGTCIFMICSGYISTIWVGWPYVFYGHGAIGLLWMMFWAPNHAGTLMNIANCVGHVCSIIRPLLVQFVVLHEEDAMESPDVFYISAVAYLASNTFYLVLDLPFFNIKPGNLQGAERNVSKQNVYLSYTICNLVKRSVNKYRLFNFNLHSMVTSYDLEKCEFKSEPLSRSYSCYGARHTQAIMLFLLVTIAYGMRVNLSVGIVAMTDPEASPNPDIPTYTWDDESIILSSFFWGYVIPQIGAGQLAKIYGPKWFITGTFAVGSLVTIIIPFMASLGSWAVILCRVLQGFTQGFIYPSCHNLLSKWVPPAERARLGTFVYAGGPFGTVLSLPFTGWLAGTSLGWPYAFYIYGAVGLLWCILWIILGKNSPALHTTMSPVERKFIEASLGETSTDKPAPTPWISIFTSLPMIALIIAHSGQNWGFSTLLTNIPTYMQNVLQYDIQSNGILSAGPYFVFWILSFVFSSITDFVIVRKYLSVGVARKIANSVGLFVPAAALLTLGLISDSESDITTVTLVLLFVAVGINGCCFSGYQVNHLDLSPVHSGTLMGITNGISNVFSIIAPLIIQFIVTDQENPLQWSIVFYISSGVYILGNVVFIIFGSGEVQPWNVVECEDDDTVDGKSETSTRSVERY